MRLENHCIQVLLAHWLGQILWGCVLLYETKFRKKLCIVAMAHLYQRLTASD
jgi:hypothetical protein